MEAKTQSEQQSYRGEPITDEGVKLATINRGPNCELRVRWKTFKGHHFFDVREWSVNPHNAQWFPTKGKGITIKPRELSEVLTALQTAIALQDEQDVAKV